MSGVIAPGEVSIQGDGLVADQARRSIHRCRVHPMRIEVRLRPGHEASAGLVQSMQPGKIDVAAVDDINGAWFGQQHIKRVNIVQLAIGDMDEAWDVAVQIEQRVQLHR
jgi:hypothetical protein